MAIADRAKLFDFQYVDSVALDPYVVIRGQHIKPLDRSEIGGSSFVAQSRRGQSARLRSSAPKPVTINVALPKIVLHPDGQEHASASDANSSDDLPIPGGGRRLSDPEITRPSSAQRRVNSLDHKHLKERPWRDPADRDTFSEGAAIPRHYIVADGWNARPQRTGCIVNKLTGSEIKTDEYEADSWSTGSISIASRFGEVRKSLKERARQWDRTTLAEKNACQKALQEIAQKAQSPAVQRVKSRQEQEKARQNEAKLAIEQENMSLFKSKAKQAADKLKDPMYIAQATDALHQEAETKPWLLSMRADRPFATIFDEQASQTME